ncbi:MAG: 50S ribosomal protein L20 [Candidatus Magasanikbacteria bacterium]|nr:50S ribosomal protein L20 [Candidatus Magasanikbacteria bacterium]
MPRVKRGQIHLKKRRSLMARAKGFKWGRKNLLKRAKVAVIKAGASAYQDRRVRKRDFRKLWNVRVNAAARANGLTYSTLIDKLHKAGIGLNRKVLSELAVQAPQVFEKIAKI